jgi:UDP-N-acetylglucosamine 2-epimerase (non-hydrolysing)
VAGAATLACGKFPGIDYAAYFRSTAGLTVSLANPGANTGEAIGDTYNSIEGLRDSDFNDTLFGDGGDNWLAGGTGGDILDGGSGSDTAYYQLWTGQVGLVANLSNSAANTGEAAGDTYTSIENLWGTRLGDTLIGDGNVNVLTGVDGDDTLDGNGGADTLVGGIDSDTYIVNNAGVTIVELFGEGTDVVQTSLASYDLGANLENLTGTSGVGQALGGSSLDNVIIAGLGNDFREVKPDRVLVQGDTTTAMAASLAAFYNRVPVGHVEAGLRSGDIQRPWPEEANRRFVDHLSDLLFAPTLRAKSALEHEGLGDRRIVVTGNTVVDALLETINLIETNTEVQSRLDRQFAYLDRRKGLLLVTGHRRESFGEGIRGICEALSRLAKRSDIEVIYPVHPNENVRVPVDAMLRSLPHVHIVEPLEYLPFCYLMSRAYLILTDSGGVQEEAPALGKPVLVMRDVTERSEGIEAGLAELVGTNPHKITRSVARLLDEDTTYTRMIRPANPYGDWRPARRNVPSCSRHKRKPLMGDCDPAGFAPTLRAAGRK